MNRTNARAEENAKNRDPIRILHAVGSLRRGGIEAWLMEMFRNIDRDEFQMDFLVQREVGGGHEPEARELGAEIFVAAGARHPVQYASDFFSIVREQGPYDVIHAHQGNYSGFVVLLGALAGIPVRISHSHNMHDPGKAASPGWRAYTEVARRVIRTCATDQIGISRPAARSLFGEAWEEQENTRVLHYGISVDEFEDPPEPRSIRDELGIPEGAEVVGHVGRFARQKNHEFLVEILRRLADQRENLHALLVGGGRRRDSIERLGADYGLEDRVTFPGVRDDVPDLMSSAMDVFLFPSRWEGLGLVLVEAQAAGLPCVYSDVIPREVEVNPDLLRRRSLEESAETWAAETAALLDEIERPSTAEALQVVRESRFNLDRGVERLERLYRETVAESDRSSSRSGVFESAI